MDVILLERVANLGNLGDRVAVRSGYARNYLLPKGKATLATPANVERFEARRAELEKAQREALAGAEGRKAKFEGFRLQITAKAGSEGKLFGSIGTSDIAEAATAAGQELARSEVRLPNGPLRTVGEHVVVVHLHTDIDVELPITISAEESA
ncbi:MAG: 50S ribosomal protein L9 [Steroidobacteraceae bacterium]